MGQFLEEIGLGHHVAAFIEQEISGEMLLEPEEEMLEELEVTSPTERLKIKVQGGGDRRNSWDAMEYCMVVLIQLVDNIPLHHILGTTCVYHVLLLYYVLPITYKVVTPTLHLYISSQRPLLRL